VPRGPSHHSNFVLDFLSKGSPLPLPDTVTLLRAELSRANAAIDSAYAYRNTVQALLLAVRERQVFESLRPGSRSSRVEPAVRDMGNRKATSSGEGTSRDKGKGRAQPEDESEDIEPPSVDENDFEGGV
jgi:hypothetical protein